MLFFSLFLRFSTRLLEMFGSFSIFQCFCPNPVKLEPVVLNLMYRKVSTAVLESMVIVLQGRSYRGVLGARISPLFVRLFIFYMNNIQYLGGETPKSVEATKFDLSFQYLCPKNHGWKAHFVSYQSILDMTMW